MDKTQLMQRLQLYIDNLKAVQVIGNKSNTNNVTGDGYIAYSMGIEAPKGSDLQPLFDKFVANREFGKLIIWRTIPEIEYSDGKYKLFCRYLTYNLT